MGRDGKREREWGGIEEREDRRVRVERMSKQKQYANTYIWNLRGKKKKGHEEPSGKTGIKTQTDTSL